MSKLLWILEAVISVIPILIAANRKHANIALISILSFFFSWTIIGWVVAMCWSIWGRSNLQEYSKQSGGSGF
ncbi:MAG TPA: superinfection immunity protein [Terracidiphilus sp.]|nr:superinfection immunity protein [Terracidiphilus sp.]